MGMVCRVSLSARREGKTEITEGAAERPVTDDEGSFKLELGPEDGSDAD